MSTATRQQIADRVRQVTAGAAPAVALVNPKYPHNVGSALRSCSAFGIRQLWFTGNRALEAIAARGRLPREERMKGYQDVALVQDERFLDRFGPDVTPVAVEVRQQAESLATFTHPARALYVFGPEDGGLGRPIVNHCHRFVIIPSRHCLNLATAVSIVLAHRVMQDIDLDPALLQDYLVREDRGFLEEDGLGRPA
jgi:tRNA C32,U32 (ribose-2'-O)-methylase TrmJ